MLTWTDLSTAATVLTLTAAAVDATLLTREKTVVYSRLLRWWRRLDSRRVPDIPVSAARMVLQGLHTAFGFKLGIRALLVGIAVSFCLTTAAGNVGVLVNGLGRTADYGYSIYPPEVYLINFVLDGATVLISIWCLRLGVSSRGFKVLALGALNLAAALCLALFCAVVTDWYGTFAADNGVPTYWRELGRQQRWAESFVRAYGPSDELRHATAIIVRPWRPSMTERIEWTIQSARFRFVGGPCCDTLRIPATIVNGGQSVQLIVHGPAAPMGYEGLFFASSTLIPTAAVVLLITFSLLGKLVLTIARAGVLRTLRAAVQVDPRKDPRNFMPATLSALVFVALSFLIRGALGLLGFGASILAARPAA